MSHTITPKDVNKRILLITLSDPYDFRTESTKIMDELHGILGNITDIVYVIYDVTKLSISFSDIIDGVSSGFARPRNDADKQLNKYSRMILVGASTLITVGAKTAARFSPERPFPVFKTVEEALDYVQTDLAKQQH
jgi:hypothetical protein